MEKIKVPKNSMHYKASNIIDKKEGIYHVIAFKNLRKTDKVDFKSIPFYETINGVDRVTHAPGAFSPSIDGNSDFWYMHPGQGDNLITLEGIRIVELYDHINNEIIIFEISPDFIKKDGKIILDGPGMLGWPVGVFHRNHSPNGSTSLNFAERYDEFNLGTEFNIYSLDINVGEYTVAREGRLDQPAE